MISVGIDVTMLNHFVSDTSSDGEVLLISNDFKCFRNLSLVLNTYDREHLLVALKSMALYGNKLVEILVSKV